MPRPKTRRNPIVSGILGLLIAAARQKIRAAIELLHNPLGFVVAGAIGTAGVWFLVTQQGSLGITHADGPFIEIGCYAYGALLMLVALTAQRGSPVRLQPGDVAWALQSRAGPRVVLLAQGLGTALQAFAGTSVGSALALALRGENPLLGVVVGCSVASLVLLVRSISLSMHALGRIVTVVFRQLMVALLLMGLTGWTVVFALTWLSRGIVVGLHEEAIRIAVALVQSIFAPERGMSPIVWGILAVSIGCVAFTVRSAQHLVEPAVRDSILSHQISQALRRNTGIPQLQGRGYRTGMTSWNRWPTHPIAALLVGHLAHTRRRLPTYIGNATVYLGISVGLWATRQSIPAGTETLVALVVIGLMAVSAPFQPIGNELDHQHLRLSGVPLCVAGFAGTALNAALDGLIALPAILVWLILTPNPPALVPLFLALFLIQCLVISFAGIAARLISTSPLGQAFVSVILATLPLVCATSALAMHENTTAWWPTILTFTGTLFLAAAIYSSLATAVFIDMNHEGT